MQAALESCDTDPPGDAPAGGAHASERRCLVSRETLPVDRLLRFVVGPDGAVVPDVDRRLPGRGLWLQATRDIVDKACAGRVFAKAARTAVSVAPDLSDRVEALLARRCLHLLGLARRTGAAVAGYEKAMAAARRGRTRVVLVASDGAEGGRGRLPGAAPGATVVALFSGTELGAVFGRDRTVHVAVADGGLAGRLAVECARLAGFRRPGTKHEE